MARQKQVWFRMYCEVVHDRKLRRLPPAQRWVWVAVLAAARQSPVPGALLVAVGQPMGPADLADIASVTLQDVRKALDQFEISHMVEHDASTSTWTVSNWGDYQFESDNPSVRVAKHRAKASDVTTMKRYKAVP